MSLPQETAKFAKLFYKGVLDETFMESCGLADLVTTCFGGAPRSSGSDHPRGASAHSLLREKGRANPTTRAAAHTQPAG